MKCGKTQPSVCRIQMNKGAVQVPDRGFSSAQFYVLPLSMRIRAKPYIAPCQHLLCCVKSAPHPSRKAGVLSIQEPFSQSLLLNPELFVLLGHILWVLGSCPFLLQPLMQVIKLQIPAIYCVQKVMSPSQVTQSHSMTSALLSLRLSWFGHSASDQIFCQWVEPAYK